MAETPREIPVKLTVDDALLQFINNVAERVELLENRSSGVPYRGIYTQWNEDRISILEQAVSDLQREISDLRMELEDR